MAKSKTSVKKNSTSTSRLLDLSKRLAKSGKPLRKLTKEELSRLGYSEKTERYVNASLKKLRKSTRTISKRQYSTAKRGGVSNEKLAKIRAGTERLLPKYGIKERSYVMPIDDEAFDKRIAQIKKKILPQWPEAEGYLIFTFSSHTFSGLLMLLVQMSWEASVDIAAEMGGSSRGRSGSSYWNSQEELQAITLRVRLLGKDTQEE